MNTEQIYNVYTLNGENVKVVERSTINNDLKKVIEFIEFIYEIFSKNGKEDSANLKYMIESVKAHTKIDLESNTVFDNRYDITGRYVDVSLFYDSRQHREYYSMAIQTDLRNDSIKKTINFIESVAYFEKQKRIVIFQKEQADCIFKNPSYNKNEEKQTSTSTKSFINNLTDVTEQNFFNLENDVYELSKELADLKEEVKKVVERIEDKVQDKQKPQETATPKTKTEQKTNDKANGEFRFLYDLFDEKYIDKKEEKKEPDYYKELEDKYIKDIIKGLNEIYKRFLY